MNTRLAPTLVLAAALSAAALTPLRAADLPPRPVDNPAPVYPFDLRKGQFEGSVTITFTVNADGRVTHPVVTESSNWVFKDLALAAVKKWKFEPAVKDGRPVSVKVTQTFSFVSQEKEEAREIARAAGKTHPDEIPGKLVAEDDPVKRRDQR